MKAGHIPRAAEGSGSHPEPETLLGYARGEIEGEAKRELQEHLSLCASCATAILDLRAFPNNPPADGEDLSDREIDAEWLRLVGREQRPKLGGWTLPLGRRSGLVACGLAASFFVALVGLSSWTIDLQNRVTDLSQPRVNVFVAQLSDGHERELSPGVEIASDARYVRFELPVADITDYPGYRISILDAGGHEIVRNSEIRRGPLGDFAIEVDVSQWPAGRGSIRLSGLTDNGESTLGEYFFTKLP